jgi:hypothetical protein
MSAATRQEGLGVADRSPLRHYGDEPRRRDIGIAPNEEKRGYGE